MNAPHGQQREVHTESWDLPPLPVDIDNGPGTLGDGSLRLRLFRHKLRQGLKLPLEVHCFQHPEGPFRTYILLNCLQTLLIEIMYERNHPFKKNYLSTYSSWIKTSIHCIECLSIIPTPVFSIITTQQFQDLISGNVGSNDMFSFRNANNIQLLLQDYIFLMNHRFLRQ